MRVCVCVHVQNSQDSCNQVVKKWANIPTQKDTKDTEHRDGIFTYNGEEITDQ